MGNIPQIRVELVCAYGEAANEGRKLDFMKAIRLANTEDTFVLFVLLQSRFQAQHNLRP